MSPVRRLDHLAIVVTDIEEALAFWRDALGLEVSEVAEVPRERSAIAFLPLENGEIELVQPTDEASGVARYLSKRGPGMHHICLEVDDLDAMLQRLKERGVQLINPEPVAKENGVRYAFIHPKSAFGVLVELYEKPR
ncbi:MAG TPA: methylmalonyl-CoA epimerase [Anaerolineae bacterium]|nr:methylmalonyl-CoA epimerase [Anaerolineae bacterium]HID83647.1 methylmalonyl-CoA epimerase [Anaerolineales bacterium]HIQ09512.1 methylmalonyl-CoA epimerase [Anaerolineaceae bacterium]